MIRSLLLAIALVLPLRGADDAAPSPAARSRTETFTAQRQRADAALEKEPSNADWLTRRGDARLLLGDARGAVADFEKEIAVDPSRDAPHWRLGIAYLFAGDFAKSAKQFEKYHAYDNRDRENGVWHFLANARVAGIEKARTQMLEYKQFDREPFPDLYDMFAGKKTGAEVIAAMEKKGLKDDALVMFFAHYYVGLNEDLLGRTADARAHLRSAVELAAKAQAGGGPGYMGHVAWLHLDALAKKP